MSTMNELPEPGLPSERTVTERLADAIASGGFNQAPWPTGKKVPPSAESLWARARVAEQQEATAPPETITEEAQRLVLGDRQADYGHPADDFARTGRIWGAILGIPDVPPELVALCMVGVKMSREVNSPKRDNRVDGIGYWLTDELIHQRASQ